MSSVWMTRGEKRKTGYAAACTIKFVLLMIIFQKVSLLICWSPIGDFRQNFGRHNFFHLPWRLKWLQLGALLWKNCCLDYQKSSSIMSRNKGCILPIQTSLLWNRKFLSGHLSLINTFQKFFAKFPVPVKPAISQILWVCNDLRVVAKRQENLSAEKEVITAWILAGTCRSLSERHQTVFRLHTYHNSISEPHWAVYM